MAKPDHWDEHVRIEEFLSSFVSKSKLVEVFILITVGVDGRPCVSGNAEVVDIHRALREIGSSENKVADVEQHDVATGDKRN